MDIDYITIAYITLLNLALSLTSIQFESTLDIDNDIISIQFVNRYSWSNATLWYYIVKYVYGKHIRYNEVANWEMFNLERSEYSYTELNYTHYIS